MFSCQVKYEAWPIVNSFIVVPCSSCNNEIELSMTFKYTCFWKIIVDHSQDYFVLPCTNIKKYYSAHECDASDKATLNIKFYHRNVIMLIHVDNHIQNVHLECLLSDIWLEIRFWLLLLCFNVKLNIQLYIWNENFECSYPISEWL